VALDAWLGDPQWRLHPVQVMGWGIQLLRRWAGAWSSDRPARLRLAGGAITALIVLLSGASGWFLEWLALSEPVGWIPLVIALASALAWRSLDRAVRSVLAALPLSSDDNEPNELGAGGWSLQEARARLGWIVGRDVAQLDREGILRAAAETASENAVDGVFAPLFWMLAGAALWGVSSGGGSGLVPGPLCLAWGMKAASTLDSMLGYRDGKLRWLGTAGARLDDCLVWPACRLVAITLPLSGGCWRHWKHLVSSAGRDGRLDPSPNAGLSQAIYARVIGIQLGGTNRYGGQIKVKPRLGAGGRYPAPTDVQRILLLTRRLLLLWLLTAVGIGGIATIMD